MHDLEKLGAFYLGKRYDLAARRRGEELVLYDSRDLLTHGVVVGMTGSGKTGLCIDDPGGGGDRRHSGNCDRP